MELTKSNYHSLEAEREFMSRSQYLGYVDCEARQQAINHGDWIEEPTKELLVGSYLHSWNDNTRKEWIAEHPDMFTTKGTLRSEYQVADKMIATLEADNFIRWMLDGQKEVIFTAEFAGAMWKVMIDVYRPDKNQMVDLKTTKSIRKHEWSEEHRARVNFIEYYHYLLQAALYCEIERLATGQENWKRFYIVAVSKEDYPDKEIISLEDDERYLLELERVKANMNRILAVKRGEVDPVRCGKCDYCRSTKRIKQATHYTEI